jgi:hypothetical protein
MTVIKMRVWDKVSKKYLKPTVLSKYKYDFQTGTLTISDANLKKGFTNPSNLLIERSTGLIDQQGADIYEGDILIHDNNVNEKYQVIWEESFAAFLLEDKTGKHVEPFCDTAGLTWRISGKILENPRDFNV